MSDSVEFKFTEITRISPLGNADVSYFVISIVPQKRPDTVLIGVNNLLKKLYEEKCAGKFSQLGAGKDISWSLTHPCLAAFHICNRG